MLMSKQNAIFVFSVGLVFILGWWLQDQQMLNYDVSQLLQSTRQMLEGGTYTQDFFIPNPPMILYLYVPPVVFVNLFHLPMEVVFRGYTFLLSLLSFLFCCNLAQAIFAKQDAGLKSIFLITLLCVYVIFPFYLLGQRDLLLILFAMPYVLAAVARLQNHHLTRTYAVTIGVLAGLGIGTKPYFILLPLAVEAYYSLVRKDWFAWMRIETLTLCGFLLIYVITSYWFFPDYYTIILPYLLQHYVDGVARPWSSLFINARVVICVVAFGFWLSQYKDNPYKTLTTMLMLVMAVMMATNIMQRSLFLYHSIPAVCIAFLLCVVEYWTLLQRITANKMNILSSVLLIAFALGGMYWYVNNTWTIYINMPILFYCFFSALFFVLLYSAWGGKKLTHILGAVGLIVALGYFINYANMSSDWYAHTFTITIISMLLVFSMFNAGSYVRCINYLLAAILGICLFILPVYLFGIMYGEGQSYRKNVLDQLITFMHTQPPHQSLYALTIHGSMSAPVVDYVDATLAERFDCLWMARGYVRKLMPKGEDYFRNYLKSNHDPSFFLNMIVEDFQRKKPNLVFVDTSTVNMDMNNHTLYFDFISYFSENVAFKSEWDKYRYLTTINFTQDKSKRIDIYKRIS